MDSRFVHVANSDLPWLLGNLMSPLVAAHFSLLHLKCFPCIWKGSLESPVRKRPWNTMRWEILDSSARQLKCGNSGTCKWASVLCHRSSPCRLSKAQAGSFSTCSLGAGLPAPGNTQPLAKILPSIFIIKLKSWVSFSGFSRDSKCCLSSLCTSGSRSSPDSRACELQILQCKCTVNTLLKTLLKSVTCGECSTNWEKSALP